MSQSVTVRNIHRCLTRANIFLLFVALVLFTLIASIQAEDNGTSEYLAIININGHDYSGTETSGPLPGAGFSESVPLHTRTMKGPDNHMNAIKDRFHLPAPRWAARRARDAFHKGKGLKNRLLTICSVGDTTDFWVKDDNDLIWRQVTATVERVTAHSNLFVDNTLYIPEDVLDLYADEFETMYTIVTTNFGPFSDRDGNGRINILLYDFNTPGSVLGYFWSKDYWPDSEAQQAGLRSNEMDVIYVRGDPYDGWPDYIDFYEYNLTTLIHEYQHLVHFGRTFWDAPESTYGYSDTWINEMMSMASETLFFKYKLAEDPGYEHPDLQGNGYLYGRLEWYNRDSGNSIRNGHGLTYWDRDGDVLANYSLSYLFGQYLALQAENGSAVFADILDYMVDTGLHDYRAVEAVAKWRVPAIVSWENLLTSWAIANVANQPTGLYGYREAFTLTPHGTTQSSTAINSGGVVYRYVNGAWSKPAGSGVHIRYVGFDENEPPSTTTTSVSATTVPATTTTTTTVSSTTTSLVSFCPPEMPIDCLNGYCCPEVAPICGKGSSVGMCFRSDNRTCPVSFLLGDDSSGTDLVRDFRDYVLYATGAGRELAVLFYEHADEITTLLRRNRSLRRHLRETLRDLKPIITAILAGNDPSFSDDVLDSVSEAAAVLHGCAGLRLRVALDQLIEVLEDGSLRKELLIPSPEAP